MARITLNEREIECEIKRSRSIKQMRLSISYDCKLSIVAPWVFDELDIQKFISTNADWIVSRIEHFSKFKNRTMIRTGRNDYLKNKEATRRLIKQRVEYFNKFYNFKFNRIAVKNQKTLWGSCSGDGNLNFNYALIKLSSEMLDYVIVHEMCHLWEFNHSKEFWRLVSLTIPQHKKIRKEMKGIAFM